MSRTHTVHFANFICRFGDSKVLLDFAEEIVLPAFLAKRERRYGDSKFFFQDAELVNFGTSTSPELLVVGRLIHDTVLSREQVIQDGKLIRDSAKMSSAPSALFALVLDTHKLLYFPETSHAPSLNTFRSTIARFIRDSHLDVLNKQQRERSVQGTPLPRNQLLKEFPSPTVELLPLSSETSLKEFLNQFKVLRQLRIDLVEPNDEIDGSNLIAKIREAKGALGAKDGSLVYRAGAKDKGLSHENTLTALTPIVEEGNSKVTLSGEDANGDKLVGNNDSFKMGMPIKDVSSNPRNAGRQLYEAFRDKVAAGLVKLQAVGPNTQVKIKQLANRATTGNDSGRE